jgi:hypothetical protein
MPSTARSRPLKKCGRKVENPIYFSVPLVGVRAHGAVIITFNDSLEEDAGNPATEPTVIKIHCEYSVMKGRR